MTGCPALASGPELGLAQALTNIDCRTVEAASGVFGRLFGPNGHLLPALTILLTLYVALFAVALLGGRTRLGINTLTPRMMTLGLVLTFATSWAAYQNVVWSLAIGAPDEIAQVIAGTNGSATIAFADRLDGLFAAVADSADQASKPAPATDTGVTPATPMVGGFTASTVLWLSALMLLLGSVGVLVTCKIALAALLACGPVFIVFALFPGTRGLFEGWLRGVVMLAVAPLLAVLIGGGAIAALEPIAAALVQSGEEPSSRLAGTMFVGSAVFVALMVMALKTAATLVAGWRLPGSERPDRNSASAFAPAATAASASVSPDTSGSRLADERIRNIVAAVPPRTTTPESETPALTVSRAQRMAAEVVASTAPALPPAANGNDPRAVEVGRRFRASPDISAREKIK
jgi:type IV secretion system protein VirB6